MPLSIAGEKNSRFLVYMTVGHPFIKTIINRVGTPGRNGMSHF